MRNTKDKLTAPVQSIAPVNVEPTKELLNELQYFIFNHSIDGEISKPLMNIYKFIVETTDVSDWKPEMQNELFVLGRLSEILSKFQNSNPTN